ncbi:UNVERIFIED_CONTAM: hypothetical protein Scaly_1398000 [Sesamum calycinum]|uniref:Pentatricopeptide repeat-containing protein n=1 Tax=Sesamum calycinum TaxID=2727403 RepID=A0AAW2PQ51_9LAMI
MYERMVSCGFHPDVVTFTSLINCYCRRGELEQGMKLWDEMNERKVSPNAFTFSILISSLCKENRLNEARDLLRQLNWREDIVPPPFIYNPVIDGFCKAGNIDEANEIVKQMEMKGCVHDKMTFTILILGHCMKGRMFEAIGMYNKMLSIGCAPDNITISSLISCLRKAGMAREANELQEKASSIVHLVGITFGIDLVARISVLGSGPLFSITCDKSIVHRCTFKTKVSVSIFMICFSFSAHQLLYLLAPRVLRLHLMGSVRCNTGAKRAAARFYPRYKEIEKILSCSILPRSDMCFKFQLGSLFSSMKDAADFHDTKLAFIVRGASGSDTILKVRIPHFSSSMPPDAIS